MTPTESVSVWHLHNGTEAMYQDPMGRRTPLVVLRVHNSMATVEYANGKTGRVSLGRIVRPRKEEYGHFFQYDGTTWRHRPNFGIQHNGMPGFFDALKKVMEPTTEANLRCGCCCKIVEEAPPCPVCDMPVCLDCISHVAFCGR